MINESQLNEFNKNGVLVLRNFYDYEQEIKPIQLDIYKIIGIIISKYNLDIKREAFSDENFFDGYIDIIKINRSWGGEIYDAVKQLPSFIRLVSNKKNEELYKQIRKSNSVGIGLGSYGIRINNPFESKYESPWHQEYPNQLRSIDGIVFWSPLHNIIKEMGPVEVLLSSHKLGFLKCINLNKNSIDKDFTVYSNDLEIENIDKIVESSSIGAPETNTTDLIIMDYLTVHKSGSNISDKARWSMQIRYFNFEDKEGQKINWQGSLACGINPQNLYPNYFI